MGKGKPRFPWAAESLGLEQRILAILREGDSVGGNPRKRAILEAWAKWAGYSHEEFTGAVLRLMQAGQLIPRTLGPHPDLYLTLGPAAA